MVWGKFDGALCLSLANHCLDVALCFRALCELPGIRRALEKANIAPLSPAQLDRLAVLALFHDLGKVNRGFQRKVFDEKAPRAGHIRELAPVFDFQALDERLHYAVMEALDAATLSAWFESEESAYSYLLASWSHHGRPLRFDGARTGTYRLAKDEWWRPDGDRDPVAAVRELTETARRAFPGAFQPGGTPLSSAPAFHHRFAGLVMLADWLGSHPHWFPLGAFTIEDRMRADHAAVSAMLRAIGLDRTQYVLPDAAFHARFGFAPRPLQSLIDTLDPHDAATQLIIAESETGSGKTEAALHWFARLFSSGEVDGLYFALPTRVAARELYARVRETIERWFPDTETRPVTVLAVPGYSQVDGTPPERSLPDADEANRWFDDTQLRLRERQWAAEHPKRYLAATVAVGTIDQALLSSVQTAHAHLRSVCLDRSLLVVDEVHASDTYTSRLLENLLRHHLGIGGRAMLLSATLGATVRQRFVAIRGGRSGGPSLSEAVSTPYPALSLADGRLIAAERERYGKEVQFNRLPHALHPEAIVQPLVDALAQGARVLVVTNTVDRANRVQRALEGHSQVDPTWLFRVNGVACPHHGRFAPTDRARLDAEVTVRLGKGSPPVPLVLIGTQTLEQSLDIDADILVTDLAPADVLLQRVGRLHRHPRARPAGFVQPRCLVLTPEEPLLEGVDADGRIAGAFKSIGYGSVYPDLRILALTLEALTTRPRITIPADNRWFVEQATHPDRLATLDAPRWRRHGQEVQGGAIMQAIQAGSVISTFDRLFGEFVFNEAGGRVATRLGADALRLPLDRPVRSPFGERLTELVIPAHMAPATPCEAIAVEAEGDQGLLLSCGGRRYRYTRLGLEKEEP